MKLSPLSVELAQLIAEAEELGHLEIVTAGRALLTAGELSPVGIKELRLQLTASETKLIEPHQK